MGLAEILEEVERRVTPTREEEERLLSLANKIMGKVSEVSARHGVPVEPMLVGSLAKGTWLRGEGDLDIFMLFPKGYSKGDLEGLGLRIAEEVAEGRGVKAYAEHPYLRFYVDGVKVDLVPALKLERADSRATAVDRTPFHLEYVRSKLDDALRAQVRLLKRFMKGVGVYGAEAKTLGFSGYVCELLTIKYQSFLGVLEQASEWRPPTTVALEQTPTKSFQHHIVVVDPTDPSRNAAAAVSLESYSTLIAASQAFLEKPTLEFFYPPPPTPISEEEAGYGSNGRHLVLVEVESPQVVEEVLWSELRSSAKGLLEHLERWGFNPYGYGFWCDRAHAYMWFEVERVELPLCEKKVGPPVFERPHAKRFIEKNRPKTLRGPWIEGERWVLEAARDTRRVEEALRREGEIALAPHIRRAYRGARVALDREALAEVSKNPGLAQEFARTYRRRPPWLPDS